MTAHRIRVLHIVLSLHRGGLERVLAEMLRQMDRTRFESHVLAVDFLGDQAERLEESATLHLAPPLPRWSMIRPARLRDVIRRIQPDIAHTHSGIWYKGSLASQMAGVPHLVHTDHGRQSPDPWSHRLFDHLASRRTDVVIAVSKVLARQLAAGVVRDPERITVVPNGVDTVRFSARCGTGALRRELGILPGTPVIGSIARLDGIKCFDVMLEAFAMVLADYRGATPPALVIAGDGPERSHLERLIEHLGLGGRAHLVGWRDDVRELHEALDIFSMSSRSEGTSISLLEAMSAEICPVVTRVGGNPDVLGAELAHRLCDPLDRRALANALNSAISDPHRRQADALAARHRVCAHFSLESMVGAYQRIYENQMSGH